MAVDHRGRTFGPYRLDTVLGEGAMGVVYRAVREADGELVALKVLRRELGDDETYRRRFEREARAAREVSHRHLVPVLEGGEAEGRPYLAVAYVDGQSLAQRLDEEGRLATEQAVRIAAQLGSALDALHRAGLVHRDVKPANILLSDDGAALTDFGLAKGTGYTVLTRAGQVVGTLDYLAPELIRGEPATPATDVYALGCVIFACLAAEPPFSGRSMFDVGAAHLEEEPADPCAGRSDTPPGLGQVVNRALAKDPAARPPTATMYAHLLRAAARS